MQRMDLKKNYEKRTQAIRKENQNYSNISPVSNTEEVNGKSWGQIEKKY